LTHRHLELRTRINARATFAVLIASVPFFLSALSQQLAGSLNVTVMSFVGNDSEVGWYGAANNIAGIALLLSPLMGWVLVPLTARADARSPEDFKRLTQRTLTLIITVTAPITLFLSVGADLIVRILFGAAFSPAVISLRTLAPMFVLTYVAMASAGALIGRGKGWTLTAVSVATVAITPPLSWILIPLGLRVVGPGGAGFGAAVALNISEAFCAVVLTLSLGSWAFSGSGLLKSAKLVGVCLVVAAVDRLVIPNLGLVRLPIDALVYCVLVYLTRAGDHELLLGLLGRILSRRAPLHASSV
jgi:O-antigen/teichoic acid export membrane protein